MRVGLAFTCCLLALLLTGCAGLSSSENTGLGWSGGVPITARPVAVVEKNDNFSVVITWSEPPPVDTSATLRYIAEDFTDPNNPIFVQDISTVLNVGAMEGMAERGIATIDVKANEGTTVHGVVVNQAVSKTYRVIVLVSMTYNDAGKPITEQVGAAWFEVVP